MNIIKSSDEIESSDRKYLLVAHIDPDIFNIQSSVDHYTYVHGMTGKSFHDIKYLNEYIKQLPTQIARYNELKSVLTDNELITMFGPEVKSFNNDISIDTYTSSILYNYYTMYINDKHKTFSNKSDLIYHIANSHYIDFELYEISDETI